MDTGIFQLNRAAICVIIIIVLAILLIVSFASVPFDQDFFISFIVIAVIFFIVLLAIVAIFSQPKRERSNRYKTTRGGSIFLILLFALLFVPWPLWIFLAFLLWGLCIIFPEKN